MSKETSAALQKPANALPSDTGKNVTTFEYICLSLARIGGMFGTTLTGTLATAFLHELYYGPAGVDSDQIAKFMAIQTTLTTVAGILFGPWATAVILHETMHKTPKNVQFSPGISLNFDRCFGENGNLQNDIHCRSLRLDVIEKEALRTGSIAITKHTARSLFSQDFFLRFIRKKATTPEIPYMGI